MKFINYTNDGRVVIQHAALILSKLDETDTLELHTMDNAIILLKKDINACLAYLSEYMGHSNLESTAYYIHLLPTLYTDLPELRLDSSLEMEADLCD